VDNTRWKKVEELFIQCADMDPEAVNAYLDNACSGDAALRNDVEKLLHGDVQQSEIENAIGKAAENIVSRQIDQWIGEQVGPYTVTSSIAEGGMGVVYRAKRSDEHFEQQVAIKFLTTAIATDELRARFRAERQILANLNHPNIAKLLDGGETDQGVPYLVMEYIDGMPLDVYSAVNRLSIDARIALFVQICSAIQYAHGNLIVHRDIKPSNILVTTDGVPMLLDFGIAKILDSQDSPQGSELTMVGSRLLTPRHASPEQIRGEPVTTASDIYSLGLLLYELLCGCFPYRIDKTSRRREIEDTIIAEDPLPPSAVIRSASGIDSICLERGLAAAKLQKTLRGDLDTIVLKALRKEPEHRYSSARELVDDLERAANNQPILARPPTLPYLLSRYWKRHRTAAIGLSATVAAILIGVTMATVGFFQAREAERVATAEAQNAAAITGFLVDLFRAADPNENAGSELSVSEVLQLGVERIETEMDDTPIVKSEVLETLSSVYKARSDYGRSAELLEKSLQLHEAHALDDPFGRARLNNDLGDLYRILDRLDEATLHLERSFKMYESLGDGASMGHADVVNNLALLYVGANRKEDAERMFFEALRLRRNLFDAPHPDIALSLHNLAWFYSKSVNLDEAERYSKLALDMRIELFGEVHPRVARTMSNLANTYFDQARWEDAQKLSAHSLAITEQVFESGHPDIVYGMYFLARARHLNGDLQGASELFARVVAAERQIFGPLHREVGVSLKMYASTLLDLGRLQQAETALRESLTILLPLGGRSTAAVDDAEALLAQTLIREGNLDEASEMLGEIPDDETPQRRLVRAQLLLAKGDAAAAEQVTGALLQEFADTPGHHLPLLPQILEVQGKAQIARNDKTAAMDTLTRALAIYAKSWDEGYWRADLVRADLAIAEAL
jgi:serine/threonine protein kinase